MRTHSNLMLVSVYSQDILRFCHVRTVVCVLSAPLGFFRAIWPHFHSTPFFVRLLCHSHSHCTSPSAITTDSILHKSDAQIQFLITHKCKKLIHSLLTGLNKNSWAVSLS